MKTHISSKGQVVIPREVRETLGLTEGTELEIRVDRDRMILKKAGRSSGWRAWRGRFKDSNLLNLLEKEHRDEIERDRKKSH